MYHDDWNFNCVLGDLEYLAMMAEIHADKDCAKQELPK